MKKIDKPLAQLTEKKRGKTQEEGRPKSRMKKYTTDPQK